MCIIRQALIYVHPRSPSAHAKTANNVNTQEEKYTTPTSWNIYWDAIFYNRLSVHRLKTDCILQMKYFSSLLNKTLIFLNVILESLCK